MAIDAKTKLRSVHNQMKQRCTNPRNDSYRYYGGRGIGFSSDWRSFKNFYNDMVATYKEGLWLDRIDTDAGYSKDNCRWATKEQQFRNMRKNHFFLFKNMSKTLPEWSRFLGIKRSTLSMRLLSYGWSVERAFTTKKAGGY